MIRIVPNSSKEFARSAIPTLCSSKANAHQFIRNKAKNRTLKIPLTKESKAHNQKGIQEGCSQFSNLPITTQTRFRRLRYFSGNKGYHK
jgi:hypothetical protein